MSEETPIEIRLPAIGIGSIDGQAVLLRFPGASEPVDTYPLRRATKKAAMRFAVGQPGRRGTIWRLWAKGDDVYLASRQTAGEIKFSLHESGDWRQQIVQPESPKTVEFSGRGDDDGRILNQWERPDPNAVGWTLALTIVLPEDQLSRMQVDTVRWDDVQWCEEPGEGQQVEFEVYVVTPGGGLMSYADGPPGARIDVMNALQIANGDVAIVLARTVASHEDDRNTIAGFKSWAGDHPASPDFDRDPRLSHG